MTRGARVARPSRGHGGYGDLHCGAEPPRSYGAVNGSFRQQSRSPDAGSPRCFQQSLPTGPTGVRATETFADRDDFWTFTLGLRVPLIDRGGALWLDVKEQKYRVEQARLEYEALRRDIHLEVRQRWLEVDTLEANLVYGEGGERPRG